MANNYITLKHKGRGNISDFMESNYIYGVTPKYLFDLNKGFIWEQMTDEDKSNFGEKYPESVNDLHVDMNLPSPCFIKIPSSRVTAEIAINQTNLQTDNSDFYAFADDKIQSIYQNEGFIADTTSKREIDCQVFGWFKSLYWSSSFDEKLKGFSDKEGSQFADLSDYIISLGTTVTENGGSFVIKLPIIDLQKVGGRFFFPSKKYETEKGYGAIGTARKNEYVFNENGEDNYLSKSSFDGVESNYFSWLISSNDLIFISFEKLEMEKLRDDETKFTDRSGFDIESIISNGVYDMIGLVDEVKVTTDSRTSQSFVEITGRDLMKLLIEDGSFFFNPSTTSDPSLVFGNENSGKQGDIREADFMNGYINNPINRLRRVTGEIDIFANRINMDISFILKGVISQLANIEVVPGYVFDSWGDDRTGFSELKPEEE